MSPRRYELTDFEWSIIQPLLPNKPRGVPRVDDRRVLNGIFLAPAHRLALGRHSRALRPADDLLQPLCSLAKARGLGPSLRGGVAAYDGDLQMIDSSSIRVHQHAANVKKGGRVRRPPLGTSLQPDAWGARGAG